jgi:hypothetical protein
MELSHRRVILVVAVAALAVLAGCTGGNGPGTATPANNSTATPADGQSIEPVAELDASYLNNNTEAAVEDGGSYTSETAYYLYLNTTRGESESWANSTQRVDFESGQGAREAAQTFLGDQPTTTTQSVYTANGTTYQRLNNSLGVSYDLQTGDGGTVRPVNLTSFQGNYTFLTSSFAYEANGTETVDGTTTVRYSSTNLTDDSYFVSSEDATVSDASSTLYVDDGVVRRASISYNVTATTGSSATDLTISLTDIGSTTVQEPDWVDDARDSAATETPS